MNNAPLYILKKLRWREITGGFYAAVLLADIKGFTSRFEEMAKLGTKGAEQISREVSETLSVVVKVCSEYGGFPVSFGGDAVTIVFPSGLEKAQFAQDALLMIKENRDQNILSINISIAAGSILWDLVGLQNWTFFCFQGSALRKILVNNLNLIEDQASLHTSQQNLSTVFSETDLVESFLSPTLFTKNIDNEFRQVTSIFVSMENRVDDRYSREFIKQVLNVAEETGGYVSGLEPNSKGYSILVIFGAPISREDNPNRADSFLESIFREASGRVKAGVATGLVFSGFLNTPLLDSYTVLGPSVNLAARLHDSASWNSIFSELAFSNLSRLGITATRELFLKGITLPVPVKVLSPWKKRIIVKALIPPLIERERILENLSKKLVQNASIYLVTGATGMGKTRLASELSKRIQNSTILHIQNESAINDGRDAFSRMLTEWFGVSSEDRSVVEFKEKLYSFVDLLDNLNNPEAERISTELLRAESILAAMLGVYWEKSLYQGLDPVTRLQNTVSVITAFLQGHCLLQSTILMIDDVQWMDSDSVTLFSAVFQKLGTLRPSILLFTRPGTGKIIKTLHLEPEKLILPPLTKLGTRQFLEWSLGCEPSEKLLDWFLGRTEGIPFFMEQYAQLLTCSEELPDKTDFPGNIHALLVSKLDRFKSELKDLVLKASVIGRVFDPIILKALSTGSNFQDLLRQGIEERIWQKTGDGLFSFVHILFRESAYNLQLHSRKQKIHLQIAKRMKFLWSDFQEKAANIAFHFEQAEENEEASLWFLEAGKFSFSRSMTVSAYEHMRKVLLLSANSTSRINAYQIIYDLHVLNGEWEAAAELIETAFCEKLLPYEIGRVKLMKASLAVNIGNPSEASELLKGIVQENADLRAEVLLLEGRVLMLQSKTEEAKNVFLGAYEALKNGTNDERLIGIKALGNASGCYLRLSMQKEAELSLKIVLGFAIETGNLILETLAVGNLSLVYKYLPGRHNDAVEMTRRHVELAKKTGSKLLELQAVGNLGSLLEYQSSSIEAFTLLKTAVELSKEYGGNDATATSLGNLGKAYLNAGNLEDALECYSDALAVCLDKDMKIHQVDYMLGIVDVLTILKRYDEAEEKLDELDSWSFPDSYIVSILNYKTKLYRLQNNMVKALESHKKCAQLNPEGRDLFEFLLEKYQITGEKKILVSCIEQGEKFNKDSSHWEFRKRLDKLIHIKSDMTNQF